MPLVLPCLSIPSATWELFLHTEPLLTQSSSSIFCSGKPASEWGWGQGRFQTRRLSTTRGPQKVTEFLPNESAAQHHVPSTTITPSGAPRSLQSPWSAPPPLRPPGLPSLPSPGLGGQTDARTLQIARAQRFLAAALPQPRVWGAGIVPGALEGKRVGAGSRRGLTELFSQRNSRRFPR